MGNVEQTPAKVDARTGGGIANCCQAKGLEKSQTDGRKKTVRVAPRFLCLSQAVEQVEAMYSAQSCAEEQKHSLPRQENGRWMEDRTPV